MKSIKGLLLFLTAMCMGQSLWAAPGQACFTSEFRTGDEYVYELQMQQGQGASVHHAVSMQGELTGYNALFYTAVDDRNRCISDPNSPVRRGLKVTQIVLQAVSWNCTRVGQVQGAMVASGLLLGTYVADFAISNVPCEDLQTIEAKEELSKQQACILVDGRNIECDPRKIEVVY